MTVPDWGEALRGVDDPESYLLEYSGLPGPRANLALARAAARACSVADLRRWASLDTDAAAPGSAKEFLVLCGVMGLGRLLAEGDVTVLAELRRLANDSRWRVREGVAMALQHYGSVAFDAMAAEMARWATGSLLERRAAAAAVCEPVLLTDTVRVKAALAILEAATTGIATADAAGRRSDEFKALRKGLGYCWSVAAACDPEVGRAALQDLVDRATASGDSDLRWIVRENLRKRRLERLGTDWLTALRERHA